MVENQCKARPVKAYIMSDLLKKFDSQATSDVVKLAIAVVGFYGGLFYCKYILKIFIHVRNIESRIFFLIL